MRARSLMGVAAVASGASTGLVALRRTLWRDVVLRDLLGRRGGPCSRALGVNDGGMVVGQAAGRPFVWDAGRLWFPFPTGAGEATAVDDSGGVVGWRLDGQLDVPWTASRPGDTPADLPLPPGVTCGRALAVAGGIVAGMVGVGTTRWAVTWRAGEASVLRGLGGDESEAHAVHRSGLVAGSAQDRHGRWRACTWVDGVAHDLGTLGGPDAAADAVSTDGRAIVGRASVRGGRSHACLWLDGVAHDLGTLGGPRSAARATDDRRRIVGVAARPDGTLRACAWVDGVAHDLGTLGGPTSEAAAVSPSGIVVGAASTGAGATGVPLRPGGWSWEEHAFSYMLTDDALAPTTDSPRKADSPRKKGTPA
jgi:probable HAF family extracellular repeat protein